MILAPRAVSHSHCMAEIRSCASGMAHHARKIIEEGESNVGPPARVLFCCEIPRVSIYDETTISDFHLALGEGRRSTFSNPLVNDMRIPTPQELPATMTGYAPRELQVLPANSRRRTQKIGASARPPDAGPLHPQAGCRLGAHQ